MIFPTNGESVQDLSREISEDVLQIKCVAWFRQNYPNAIIHHSPNGGVRSIKTARRLKAMGVVAGFPDLFIIEPRGEYCGLFVELKNGKTGRVSRLQCAFLAYLKERKYKAVVCRSFIEFCNEIKKYYAKN